VVVIVGIINNMGVPDVGLVISWPPVIVIVVLAVNITGWYKYPPVVRGIITTP
jgi:hypothetical protein